MWAICPKKWTPPPLTHCDQDNGKRGHMQWLYFQWNHNFFATRRRFWQLYELCPNWRHLKWYELFEILFVFKLTSHIGSFWLAWAHRAPSIAVMSSTSHEKGCQWSTIRIYAQPKMVKNGQKWSKIVKKNLFAKIRFRPYTFIIRGLDFFKILLTVRGGGGGGVNPYGQADRRKDTFFLTTSLKCFWK